MNRIDEKLESIISSKIDIKSAISEKGVSGITDVLSTYADKIREIQGGSQMEEIIVDGDTLEFLNIPEKYQTPNYEEYFADPIKFVIKYEDEDDYILYGNLTSECGSEHGYRYCYQYFTAVDAFHPLTKIREHVDTATGWTEFILATQTELSVTENGTYYPNLKQGELFFSDVNVNVPTGETIYTIGLKFSERMESVTAITWPSEWDLLTGTPSTFIAKPIQYSILEGIPNLHGDFMMSPGMDNSQILVVYGIGSSAFAYTLIREYIPPTEGEQGHWTIWAASISE